MTDKIAWKPSAYNSLVLTFESNEGLEIAQKLYSVHLNLVEFGEILTDHGVEYTCDFGQYIE